MLERSEIEKKYHSAFEPVIKDLGLCLYDLEYNSHSSLIRLYIMNLETMSAVIDDCVAVDKALTPVFEETEWIPEDITLEVSSPGLYRPLRTKEHFEWVKGQEVQLHLKQKLDFDDLPRSLKGQKKIKVKLVSVDEDFLLVNDGKADREVKLLNIKKANLETAL